MTNRLTLDYGMRFVHQQPQYETTGQASNFLPEEYSRGAAPVLYVAGCANGVYPCTGTNRQAMNPVTGQFLGPELDRRDRRDRPEHRQPDQRHVRCPARASPRRPSSGRRSRVAPRFGMAYDLTGQQKFVFRGGGGLFFDRPSGNSVFAQVLNPPTLENVTVRYGQLQTLGSGGLTTATPPALNVFEYDSDLPSSVQWNGGVQMALPWAMALDVSYVGQHQYNILQNVDINRGRLRRGVPAAEPGPDAGGQHDAGGTAVVTDLMRRVPGLQLDHPDRRAG